MNRKQRKLKEIRKSNYVRDRNIVHDCMKVSNDVAMDLLEIELKKPPISKKWLIRKFNIELVKVSIGLVDDDFVQNIKTIMRKYVATRKVSKSRKVLRYLK